MFCQIFNVDKVVASFTGRPPLLSRRYASTPLPLDLSDEVLLCGPERIKEAVAGLDEGGWNQDGCLYSTTILRGRYLLSSIRDEIFEIALGHLPTSTERLQLVKPIVPFIEPG
jgi:hypothetical protein